MCVSVSACVCVCCTPSKSFCFVFFFQQWKTLPCFYKHIVVNHDFTQWKMPREISKRKKLPFRSQSQPAELIWVLICLTCVPCGPGGPWGPLAPCRPWNKAKCVSLMDRRMKRKRERERNGAVPLVQEDRWALVLRCPQEIPYKNRRDIIMCYYSFTCHESQKMSCVWCHTINQLSASVFKRVCIKWACLCVDVVGPFFSKSLSASCIDLYQTVWGLSFSV